MIGPLGGRLGGLPEALKTQGTSVKAGEVVGHLAAQLAISGVAVGTPVTAWLHRQPLAAAAFRKPRVRARTHPGLAPKPLRACCLR